MANLNRLFLMGNLTRDPELRKTQNSVVCQLGVAVNRRFKYGETLHDETVFVDAEAWGRMGEVIEQYLQKGDPVFIEGRLKQDHWKNKDGQNRTKMKVVIESFQFIQSSQQPPEIEPNPPMKRKPARPQRAMASA